MLIRIPYVSQHLVIPTLDEIAVARGVRIERTESWERMIPRKAAKPLVRHTAGRIWLLPRTDRYRAFSQSEQRLGAVCWHGHRDVMADIFDAWEDATIIAREIRYLGKDDFYLRFPSTYYPYHFNRQSLQIRYCRCDTDWR